MPDVGVQPAVYFRQGGKALVIDGTRGGSIQSPDGSQLLGGNGRMSKQIQDVSAEATYYMVASRAGKITKFSSIIDSAILTADATATLSINGVAVTNGVLTLPLAASAAGAQATIVPTALNTVAVGDVVSFVVTGGGSAGTGPRAEFFVETTSQ